MNSNCFMSTSNTETREPETRGRGDGESIGLQSQEGFLFSSGVADRVCDRLR